MWKGTTTPYMGTKMASDLGSTMICMSRTVGMSAMPRYATTSDTLRPVVPAPPPSPSLPAVSRLNVSAFLRTTSSSWRSFRNVSALLWLGSSLRKFFLRKGNPLVTSSSLVSSSSLMSSMIYDTLSHDLGQGPVATSGGLPFSATTTVSATCIAYTLLRASLGVGFSRPVTDSDTLNTWPARIGLAAPASALVKSALPLSLISRPMP
mmetsp:Transcript_1887/g.2924  ORF Transcript_1887/g.2924 Transcript_1887/m.2924 type:complete len:207 (-) Transcript_1887:790-1410(-)